MMRIYTCPKCTRLLMTASEGKEMPHECVIPTADEEVRP